MEKKCGSCHAENLKEEVPYFGHGAPVFGGVFFVPYVCYSIRNIENSFVFYKGVRYFHLSRGK